jgi:hypothetical protein
LTVATGPATFAVARTGPHLLARAAVGGAQPVGPDGLRVVLTDRAGGKVQPTVERCAVEVAGPIRTTVRLEGVFAGRAGLRFVARLSFFAGTGLVRVALTVHNPRRARHRGGLWDLGDAGSVLFRDLSLSLGLRGEGVAWTAEPGQPVRSTAAVEIYQDSSGGENWQSRNHVNREGRVPCSFRGYRVRAGGAEERGLRASPVVGSGGVTAALPEFWQQFPKAIGVGGGALRVGLFPEEFADLHELQGGERKTHVVWLDFAGGSLDWVHDPAHVVASPRWYADSGAVLYLTPADEAPDPRLDALLADVIGGKDDLFARREVIDEYGWRNYGDLHADHEGAYYKGPPPVISHFNNQYDVVYGAFLQHCRTGDPRWFALLDPLARHVMDVDVYHTTEDKAAYNGGLFWHTDHYRDAATSTHRSYSRANVPPGGGYGGGPGNTHNYASGLLHYHYLTGDPEARAAVFSLADWVIDMDDGSKHVLGLLDDGPTGLASHNGEAVFSGPGRGSGNSLNVLLDAWLLGYERKYLDKAEEIIRRVVHPADDVAARDLLEVESRWSYTVFLSALARYLELKGEAGAFDRAYAYARASLIRYARWMLEHEKPYFDQRDELEFPTEVWAAHEVRKANVFRLAARFADGALAARLEERGREFAERAWGDVLSFESRTVVRSVAILMIEATKDLYLRTHSPEGEPAPASEHEFGEPQKFVYQKLRVRAALKTPGGLLRAVFRLLNPFRWHRLRHWK